MEIHLLVAALKRGNGGEDEGIIFTNPRCAITPHFIDSPFLSFLIL